MTMLMYIQLVLVVGTVTANQVANFRKCLLIFWEGGVGGWGVNSCYRLVYDVHSLFHFGLLVYSRSVTNLESLFFSL